MQVQLDTFKINLFSIETKGEAAEATHLGFDSLSVIFNSPSLQRTDSAAPWRRSCRTQHAVSADGPRRTLDEEDLDRASRKIK